MILKRAQIYLKQNESIVICTLSLGRREKEHKNGKGSGMNSFLGSSEIMCIFPIAFSLPKSTILSHLHFSHLEKNCIIELLPKAKYLIAHLKVAFRKDQ